MGAFSNLQGSSPQSSDNVDKLFSSSWVRTLEFNFGDCADCGLFTPSRCGQHAGSSENSSWHQWIPGVLNGFLAIVVVVAAVFIRYKCISKNLFLVFGVTYKDQKTTSWRWFFPSPLCGFRGPSSGVQTF